MCSYMRVFTVLHPFCKIPTSVKIQFDELAIYLPQYIVFVCGIDQAFQMFLSGKQPLKIVGIVISDKSDLTKIMSP